MSQGLHVLRPIGLAAAGLTLAWLVISTSLAAFLAGHAPHAALWLSPGDPQALLSLAEGRLDPAVPEAQDQARGWAEAALASDPVNARALRILGQAAQAAGDESRAARYMEAAASRSVQESWAVHWLLKNAFDRKDYAGALRFADTLLRTRSRALPLVQPFLARMAETPEAAAELEGLLAGNPPWRRSFFAALPRTVTDARTPLRLLLALRQTPDPPTLADLRGYVRLLMQHKLYELAYYAWLQFLPPAQLEGAGTLFNGSFELDPSHLPFDWSIGGGRGATVESAARSDSADQRALVIVLGPGRVELRGAEQTLMLGPGTYRLQAKHRGEIIGPRGLAWRVSCAGRGGPPLGQSPMMLGVVPDWQTIELTFSVPEKDCRAQRLRLMLDSRMPSEQLVSGVAWVDDVHIARAE